MLREAFERHARPDNSKAELAKTGEAICSSCAAKLQTHRSRLIKVAIGALLVAGRRLAAGARAAADDQHRGRHQCAADHAARADRRRDRRRPGRDRRRHRSSSPARRCCSIVNRRAERGRLDDLRRLIDQLEGERVALIARRDDLQGLHADLVGADAGLQGRARCASSRRAPPSSRARSPRPPPTARRPSGRWQRAMPLADSETMTKRRSRR